MRNFTFNRSGFFRLILLIVFLLLNAYKASAQFYTKHYIAPAPWQYFSKANEIVIATNSTTTVTVTVSKSDGTNVTTLTCVKGAPAIYRFAGKPSAAPALALDTVLNAAGLIVSATSPVSINLRNVASDALGGDGTDKDIKGNAALTSFGDAGIGVRFRVGYYRDGSLGNFGGYGDQRPIYSMLAINNGTSIKLNGNVIATLNAGESYLFKAPMGSLVESSNPIVMNTSAAIDTPNGGCGDAAYNQIPPEAVLGSEYFIERGKGVDAAEQTTVIATKPNTTLTINSFSATGALITTVTKTLVNAGDFYTFLNGISNTNFSASRVLATNNVVVYSGTAQSCEVDVSTIAPVSECGGSNFVETAKFRNYGTGSLPYFGYILLKDASSQVMVNGANIETIAGIGARHQLGSTGWYLINFEDTQIGSPNVLSISSTAKLTVSIVQQGGGFSMAGFFSNFAARPEDPTMNYISGGGCTNSSATLTTPANFSPYQWFYNGVAISGANSNSYVAAKSGSYSVSSTLACGSVAQSKPVSVTLCTDLGITKTVNIASPCVNSNIEFTVTASNLGLNNATGVSVNDLLPSGYTFVSSTASVGIYNSTSGVWSIGDLDPSMSATLKVIATVKSNGIYNNTAAFSASVIDSNAANNSASVSITPKALPIALSLSGSTICTPSAGGTITSTTSVSGVSYQLYNSGNVAVQTAKSGNGSGLSWSNIGAGTGYYVVGTNSESCSSTSNVVSVINDTQKPTITCPASVTKTTDANSCTATGVVLGTPVTADNCGVASVTNNAPSAYPIGVTTVTWTVKDNSGNTQTCTQTVTISDNQKPTITCPANVTKTTDTNSCTATGVVLGTPVTADNCGIASVTNDAPSTYPIGVTTVTWTAKDNSGNIQTCTQTVTINDNQKPTITCPANVTKTTDANSCTATGVVLGTPVTADNCGIASVTNDAPYTYPIGVTTVTWTAKDNSGNTQTCTQTVTITDNQKPTITCPANITVSSDVNSCTATGLVLGTPVTADNCSVASVINNAPASYPVGNTTVVWTVTDAAGNTETCNQIVKVVGPIKAQNDIASSFNGLVGGTAITNVLGNDFLNCNNVILSDVSLSLSGTLPSVLTFDITTGAVSVNANTPTGTYSFDYKICEKANTNNCSAATTTVEVVNGLVANADSYSNQTSGTTAVNVGNVTSNDKLNGTAVTSTNTALTPKTEGPLSVDAEGELTLEANTASGTYTLTYNICESGANPSNCKTATATVEVVNGLVANTDSYSNQVSGTATLNVGNVTSNDKLNGTAVTSENTAVTSKTEGPLKVDADGELTLAAKTPSGTYTIEYTICESGANPSNCKTATATVEVVNGLVANTDSYTNQTSGTTAVNVGNVTSNDKLNGTAVTSTNTALTPKTEGPLSVDANGELTLEANTASGTYTLTYNICESGANPSNCKTATATVEVVNGLVANTDIYTNQTTGTTVVNVGNVTSNDKLNGTAVTSVNTAVTPKTEGPLSVNAEGELTLEANTASGTYTLTYNICESGANPSNCKTATATVEVVNGLIANTDSYSNQVSGTTVVNVGNVTSNDKLNGTAVTSANTAVTPKTEGPLSVDAEGELTLEANTASGTYMLTYNICESGANPSNCKTATATVEVKNEIKALIDNISPINGSIGGTTTISLIDNDTLNGKNAIIGVNPGDVTIAIIGTLPTGLTLNANGAITVAPNTPAANYNLQYTICEVGSNPSNCDTVTSIVPVTAANLVANADAVQPVTGSNTAQELGVNVLDNDTKDGQKLNPSDIKLTVEKADPKGYLILNADGTLTLGANAPAGNYELTYTICEKLNSGNCSSNTVSVTVTAPVIDAIADTITPINGNIGDNTISLVANDTLNGSSVVIGTNAGEVTFTLVGTLPTGLTLNADYTITVAPNTAAGNYEVKYTICDNNNSGNCDTVTSIVPVTAANLVANADAVSPVTGSNTAQDLGVNVLDNDTKDGQKLNPSDIKLTVEKADPKGYLILNADGTLILGANAPAGNYELTYTICEKLNSGNCSSNTVSVIVTVPVIDAIADTITPINGNIGDNTISLVANDTLNGNPVVIGTNAGEVTFTLVGTLPTGLTLNADYSITVAPNTAAGNYEVKYTICDNNNPSNCDTVTSIVPVTAANLVANADAVPAVTGSNKAQDLGVNVLDNDTKNGQKLNPSDIKLTVEKADPKGYLILNADGTLTLGANAPAGNYELTYTICEKLNSGNCSSNTVSVTVTAPVIDAIADTISPINGNIGDNTISLVANDTLNGNPVVIGTNAGEVSFTLVGTLPTGLTLKADYSVTVAPNTPAANYEVKYTICDNNNSGNCDTVTSIVQVTAANLVANADAVQPVTGSNTAQELGVNVLDNDTKDGQKLNPKDVKLTVEKADPKGYFVLNADGTLTLGANAPAGNYELTYTICEKLNSGNCSSNTVSVIVTAPVIDAIADTISPINGNIGDNTISLVANDTLNGNPVVIGTNAGEVSFTLVGTLPTGLTLKADYSVTVAPNTPAANYEVKYTICDNNNSGNCDTVTSIVQVTAANLVANADAVQPVTGSNTAQELGVNVLDNDTKDGQKLNPKDVKLTVEKADPKGYLVLNADGTLTLGANAPAGNYELTYTICEKLNSGNCSSNTVSVTVTTPVIDAIADTITPINGNIGDNTISLVANDTLNGNPVVIGTNAGEVTFTLVGTLPTGLTLNADYSITVAPNTAAGNYEVKYTICDNNNPSNCDTVTSIVPVTAANLVANADAVPAVTGSNKAQDLGVNVLDNDTKNGQKLNPSDIKLTVEKADPKGYLILNADGTLTLGANAPAGNYELTYTICEKLNSGNCSSNTVSVTVTAPVIDAIADTISPINGNIGDNTISLVANDTLNGNPVVIGTNAGEVSFTLVGTLPTGLTLKADYSVTVAPNTPAANYEVKYTICDNNNSGNCDTVTSIVQVTAANLVANADAVQPVTGSNTAQELGVNVLDNDTKDGQKLNPKDVKLTVEKADPKGYFVLNADGTLTLGANAPAGNYELTYTICEKLNSGNCSSNTVSVIVTAPVIDAIADTISPINGNIGDNTISLVANDTLNGNPVVIGTNAGEVSFTLVGTLPTGLTLKADYSVTVAPNTPAANYEVKYTICDNNNSGNCDTVTSIVQVTAANLVANADAVQPVTGSNTAQELGVNVLDNDTKDGQKLNPKDVKLTVEKADPKGYFVLNADGTLTLGANAPAGNYELTYTICEKLNSGNCSSNTVSVTVTAPVASQIIANNDEAGPVDSKKGLGASLNIFANDILNGVKPNPSDVILKTVVANPNLVLNSDGSVNIAANTPSGIYQLTYQICEAANTSNCSQAIVKITVQNSADPVTPNAGQLNLVNDTNISVDGINGSLEFVNVLDNDLIDGQPINPANVIIKPLTTSTYFEWNTDGTVNVKPNTPGATYTLNYQVCEKANPTNCSTAVLTVFVEVPSISVIKTAVFNDENKSGFANAGETISYRFTVTNTGNVPLVGITLNDPLPGVIVSGQAINLAVNESNETNFIAVYKITQQDINSGSVSNQASVKGRSARGVEVEDQSDDMSNSGDSPTVLDLSGCSIQVMNAFSPNGDDKNARFYIRGIECYPDNTVEIYNRWGVLVFAIDQYNNSDRVFVGYSNGRSTIKQTEGLPVGTYFYILKYKDSANHPNEKSGYLYINK